VRGRPPALGIQPEEIEREKLLRRRRMRRLHLRRASNSIVAVGRVQMLDPHHGHVLEARRL
jgi:hypothetical protein